MQSNSRVWLILPMLLFVFFDRSRAFGFCFDQAGEMYQINPALIRAIAQVESDFNPSAVNHNPNNSYDTGLMQINSRWKKQLGNRWQHLSDPCYNVLAGTWILRQCMDRYGYAWDAVACYHTGKGLSDSSEKKQARAKRYVRRIQNALGIIE
jgi:soluble lytic murein transglycosylase-like protein